MDNYVIAQVTLAEGCPAFEWSEATPYQALKTDVHIFVEW